MEIYISNEMNNISMYWRKLLLYIEMIKSITLINRYCKISLHYHSIVHFSLFLFTFTKQTIYYHASFNLISAHFLSSQILLLPNNV